MRDKGRAEEKEKEEEKNERYDGMTKAAALACC
jgi:hypothetical protein